MINKYQAPSPKSVCRVRREQINLNRWRKLLQGENISSVWIQIE